MRNQQKKKTFIIMALFISGLFIILSRNQASATMPLQTPSPASRYSEWEPWSAPISSSEFDITRCSPDVAASDRIQQGDFNGDGRVDLLCKRVAANGGTTPYVQLAGQNSFSAWEAWRNIAVEPGCEFDLVADFNGDGLDDWLCSILWQGRYESFYFRSQGTSFSSVGYLIGSVNASEFDLNRCRRFFVEDVNQDGREDAICHYLYPDNTSATLVALDDGEYTHRWDLISPVAAANNFRLDLCGALRFGDVNGDRMRDQICHYQYPDGHSRTWVQLAMGGTFSRWQPWSESSAAGEFDLSWCHFFHAVDVDGDGLIDQLCLYDDGSDRGVLVQTDGPDTIELRYGGWETWFEQRYDMTDCRPFSADIPAVIDVNGDGKSDILCAWRGA